MNRITAAWQVLMGRAQIHPQILAEWAEVQSGAAEMFSKMNALAARLVKAEKKMMQRQMEALEADPMLSPDHRPPAQTPADRKAQLRRQVFGHLNPTARGPNGLAAVEERE